VCSSSLDTYIADPPKFRLQFSEYDIVLPGMWLPTFLKALPAGNRSRT